GPAEHHCSVHRRIPDPSIGRIPVRMDGRPDRSQIHLPGHADWHGDWHWVHRLDPDLPADRLGCRSHPVPPAHGPRAVPGRGIWRGPHLPPPARLGRKARALYTLGADLSPPWAPGGGGGGGGGPAAFFGTQVCNTRGE